MSYSGVILEGPELISERLCHRINLSSEEKQDADGNKMIRVHLWSEWKRGLGGENQYIVGISWAEIF